jgi:hypothetical protein
MQGAAVNNAVFLLSCFVLPILLLLSVPSFDSCCNPPHRYLLPCELEGIKGIDHRSSFTRPWTLDEDFRKRFAPEMGEQCSLHVNMNSVFNSTKEVLDKISNSENEVSHAPQFNFLSLYNKARTFGNSPTWES